MREPLRIPSALLDRHGTQYRSFVTGSRPTWSPHPQHKDTLFGIGFLQKRDADTRDNDPAHYSAIYVLSGRGTYRDSTGFAAPVAPGTVFQRLPGRRHTVIFDPAVRYVEIFLAFSPHLLDPMATILALHRRPVVHPGLDLALIRDLAAAVDALAASRERELPRLYLHHLGLLAAMFQRGGPGAPQATDDDGSWIDEACRVLAEDVQLRPALDQVARRLSLGYEAFRKRFRERMGISPGEYRIRRRLDRARELLTASAMPVKEIASALGYPNASVFSLQFKSQIGRSPEQYRDRGG